MFAQLAAQRKEFEIIRFSNYFLWIPSFAAYGRLYDVVMDASHGAAPVMWIVS
jgi:hypothetical protein